MLLYIGKYLGAISSFVSRLRVGINEVSYNHHDISPPRHSHICFVSTGLRVILFSLSLLWISSLIGPFSSSQSLDFTPMHVRLLINARLAPAKLYSLLPTYSMTVANALCHERVLKHVEPSPAFSVATAPAHHITKMTSVFHPRRAS